MFLTKKEILNKSLQEFLNRGIQNVTMNDIANVCGVSRQALYENFKNKNDLLNEVFIDELKKGKICLTNIHKHSFNAITELMEVLNFFKKYSGIVSRNTLHDLKKHHTQIFVSVLKLKSIIIIPLVERNIQRGIKEKVYKNNLTISEIEESFISILSLFYNQNKHQIDLNYNTSINFFLNLFLHRLLSIDGLAVFNKINDGTHIY